MMVVDTSALVALKLLEPEASLIQQRIARDEQTLVPATAVVEFALVRKCGADRMNWLRAFVRDADLEVAVIGATIAAFAADAAERYGRGTGHPAGLNFGDCLSYAVAKHLNAPLLYKGDDFVHTDIESALAP